MTMRNKHQTHSKMNQILFDAAMKSIEKDPAAYDAILWLVVESVAVIAPSPDDHYELEDALVIDELENEKELGEPLVVVVLDAPTKVSGLVVNAGDGDLTGDFSEPIAVKINQSAVPEGSVLMFFALDSNSVRQSRFYTVQSLRATDTQGLNHIYYLLPFGGDSESLASYVEP